jgi:hypothetical protein
MIYNKVLTQGRDGSLWLRTGGREAARQVCTAAQAAALLKRTRRQVYRHIDQGLIASAGKLLGELLLDMDSVKALSRRPQAVQPLPARLGPLFPEHDVRALNAGRDSVLVIARVLETGLWKDARWLLRRYSRRDIQKFLQEEGARLLTPRCLALWSLVFDIQPQPLSKWRRRDPWRSSAA